MKEIWKAIPRHEKYEVSNLGNVRSVKNKTLLKPWLSRYVAICFKGNNGNRVFKRVHVLVTDAFLGPIPSGMERNHKNCNRRDNRLENLEYITPSQNMKHAYVNGLISIPKAHHSKLDCEDIVEIKGLIALGNSRASIARKYNVHRSAISKIAVGRNWKNVLPSADSLTGRDSARS